MHLASGPYTVHNSSFFTLNIFFFLFSQSLAFLFFTFHSFSISLSIPFYFSSFSSFVLSVIPPLSLLISPFYSSYFLIVCPPFKSSSFLILSPSFYSFFLSFCVLLLGKGPPQLGPCATRQVKSWQKVAPFQFCLPKFCK